MFDPEESRKWRAFLLVQFSDVLALAFDQIAAEHFVVLSLGALGLYMVGNVGQFAVGNFSITANTAKRT
jgi:hypothetical protein